jgi:O-antigen ligase
MRQAYVDLHSPLDPACQLRPHNQYLTLWAASGLLASLAWLLAIAGLWRIPGPWRSPARVFALVLALSCLTEDTLESQAGATFAGVFMGMFSGARAAGPPPAPRPLRAPRLKPPR